MRGKNDLYYVFLSVLSKKKSILNNIGDDEIEGTPVPIPNTEVKLYDAENTKAEKLWEDRGSPILNIPQ